MATLEYLSDCYTRQAMVLGRGMPERMTMLNMATILSLSVCQLERRLPFDGRADGTTAYWDAHPIAAMKAAVTWLNRNGRRASDEDILSHLMTASHNGSAVVAALRVRYPE